MSAVSNKWFDDYQKRQMGSPATPKGPGRGPVDSSSCGQEDSELERPACTEQVAAEEGERCHATRCFISIESRRRRLIDPRANLYGGTKALEDACVYAGILLDDKEAFSEGAVYQTKIKNPEPEETIIRIWKIDNL